MSWNVVMLPRTPQESLTSVDILKLARLVRIARLDLLPNHLMLVLRFLQKMDRFSQYSAVILSLLMVSFFLLAHWLACLWYAYPHPAWSYNPFKEFLLDSYEFSKRT